MRFYFQRLLFNNKGSSGYLVNEIVFLTHLDSGDEVCSMLSYAAFSAVLMVFLVG